MQDDLRDAPSFQLIRLEHSPNRPDQIDTGDHRIETDTFSMPKSADHVMLLSVVRFHTDTRAINAAVVNGTYNRF